MVKSDGSIEAARGGVPSPIELLKTYKAAQAIGLTVGALPLGETLTFAQQDAANALKGATKLTIHTLGLAELADRRAVKDVLAVRLMAL